MNIISLELNDNLYSSIKSGIPPKENIKYFINIKVN